jgi:ABC-type Fe3+ transport system permease subunit
VQTAENTLDAEFLRLVWHSLGLALAAALLALLFGLFMAYGKRLRGRWAWPPRCAWRAWAMPCPARSSPWAC